MDKYFHAYMCVKSHWPAKKEMIQYINVKMKMWINIFMHTCV